jgi:hypothetical protein
MMQRSTAVIAADVKVRYFYCFFVTVTFAFQKAKSDQDKKTEKSRAAAKGTKSITSFFKKI